MVACRRVGRVYCFQSPSATVDYRPTHFVDHRRLSGRKLKAIDAFGSQAGIRDYLEPELITSTARYWARYGDGTHAEPFEAIRDRARCTTPGDAPATGVPAAGTWSPARAAPRRSPR